MIKIAIVGSREFNNYQLFREMLLSLLPNETVMIVSGGAKGTDSLAERFANEYSIPFCKFPANWEKYGKSAGVIRNKQITEFSDRVYAFWDNESKGTKNTIELFKSLGKGCIIINI